MDFLGSTSSELDQLYKDLDGNIRKLDGTVPIADQTAGNRVILKSRT